MGTQVPNIPATPTPPTVTWESLPPGFVLPDAPVENQQLLLAAALTDALGSAGRIQPEMLIVSNLGLVATVHQRMVVKAPDWLYVPRVHPVAEGDIRRSYTPYVEGDPVAIVMEFLSQEEGGELSVRSTPPYGKLYFYERILQVPTYVTYDPDEPMLEVRCWHDGRYVVQTANAEGHVWIPELNLWLGIWHGERLGQTMNWLRWWDGETLLLWSAEQAAQEHQQAQEHQRAEQNRQQVEALAAKLREFGIDPDRLI